MKLVLIKNVPKIGNSGDICEVKEGFARNYLLPQGLAVVFGDPRANKILAQEEVRKKDKKTQQEKIKQTINEINGLQIEIFAKVNQKDQLFAAINQEEINKKIFDNYGVRPASMDGLPIKSVGLHKIILKFTDNYKAEIKVLVSKKV